ncbi:MAG: pyrroline-5-carboxylate reductase [Chloroflexi bacterium]|nr:pyrroline-5-carboxylate reductase [Chloroflexota bacterium]
MQASSSLPETNSGANPLSGRTVAFIGSGAMAEAIINGLLSRALLNAEQIIASDPRAERGQELVERYGLRFTPDNIEAARAADLLVLAIKPQVLGEVMPTLRQHAHHADLVLSILAGVRIRTLAAGIGNAHIVRSMPNTPAQIGRGMIVWTATTEVPDAQRLQAKTLLGALGEELYVEDEKYLDMATAISGSAPAYVFLFIEALIDAGVHLGFTRSQAERLVLQTLSGSVEYTLQSGLHPAQLRNQVTSAGGTTAAALYELEKGGLRTVLADAVWAAYHKSVVLGDAQAQASYQPDTDSPGD